MLRSSVAAVAVALTLPAAASPLTAFEDFEAVSPKDTPLGSLVTNVGTFTPDPGLNVFVAPPGYTNFGPGLNPTTSSILVANGDEGWSLDLAFHAATIEVTFYLNDLGPAQFRLYDKNDNPIGGINFSASPIDDNVKTFLIGYSDNRIARATWSSTLGGRLNTGWDNITISRIEEVVPEPSSWALMIGGFALVGAAVRRTRRAPA